VKSAAIDAFVQLNGMIATFKFSLPEEQAGYDAARLGGEALSVLWKIEQHCRSRLKYGKPSADETHALEFVRSMIPAELLEQ